MPPLKGGRFLTSRARTRGYTAEEIRRLRASGAWVGPRGGVYAARTVIDPADAPKPHVPDVAAALLVCRVDLGTADVAVAPTYAPDCGRPPRQARRV